MKTKQITGKNKVMIDSAKYLAKKIKKPIRTKQKLAKSNLFSKRNLIGGMITFIVMMLLTSGANINIEGTAQAETQKINQFPMKIVFELYNGQASHHKKKIVRDVLLASGVNINLCAEIAETIVEESNKTDIPVEMYLAIMKKESTFRSNAVSSAKAKGLMQIQGGTWNAYVKKHDIPVTREEIFHPQANIMVASVILKELYNNYEKLGYQEPVIWNYVLAAYYAGPASLKNGIKGYHWRYIEKVKEYYSEFELQMEA